MTTLPRLAQNEFTNKLAVPVLAYYDWLSGSPMTERERLQREIAEAHTHFPANAGGV